MLHHLIAACPVHSCRVRSAERDIRQPRGLDSSRVQSPLLMGALFMRIPVHHRRAGVGGRSRVRRDNTELRRNQRLMTSTPEKVPRLVRAFIAGGVAFLVSGYFFSLIYAQMLLVRFGAWGFVVGLFLVPGGVSFLVAWRIYRGIGENTRPLTRRCSACGYDLTGNTTGRCPECGTHIETRP